MKKQYITPTIEVVQIKKMTLMAGSPGDKSQGEAYEWGARGFSLFDEDDSEDEY
jgi:hypothetical protein